MTDICLVLLCGLPGVGKSTFAKQIHSTKGSSGLDNFITVEYDHLLPPDLEKNLILQDQEKSQWKSYRAEIVTCVDNLIACIRSNGNVSKGINFGNKPSDNVSEELWEKFIKMVTESTYLDVNEDKKICILIDDNMYYRSMRYTYFQLARKYQIGFCQIYLHADIETAISQNASRVVKVTDDVISVMAKKMEIPDGIKNIWEENSITVTPSEDKQPVFSLINKAFSNPVQPVEEVDIEQQAQSRVVCSESFVYQSDQILRRFVSQHMAEAKGRNLSKQEMKSLAEHAQTVRKNVLDDLKSGSINIPNDLVAMATDSCKDANSALFLFLDNSFSSYLKEIKR